MPTIQIEANLSNEQILNAARQMSRQELSQLVEQVLALRARHEAPVLPAAESELLLKINQPVPDDLQRVAGNGMSTLPGTKTARSSSG
jgi:hypothetical protein